MISTVDGPTGSSLWAAYQEVNFQITQVIPSPSPMYGPLIEVEVYIDGITDPISIQHYNSPDKITPVLTDFVYVWNIDVSEVLQGYFNNNDSLLDLGYGGTISPPELYADFNIVVYEWLENSNGLLEKVNVSVTSQTYTSINARREHRDPKNFLDEFNVTTSTGPQRFLTNQPSQTRVLCLDDSMQLTAFNLVAATYPAYFAYNSNGTLIANASLQPITDSFGIIGVGPLNIINTVFPFAPPAFLPDHPSVHRYEIILSGERVSIYVNRHCCTSYKIHFLNQYGQYDMFSVIRNRNESYVVKSSNFEKIKPQDYGYRDRGLNRLQAQGTEQWKMEKVRVTESEHNWLKELMISPDVYIEENGGYLPVVVKDKRHKILNNNEDYDELSITLIASNSEYSHRN